MTLTTKQDVTQVQFRCLIRLLTMCFLLGWPIHGGADEPGKKRFYDPIERDIEGWSVSIDPAMLDGDFPERKQVAENALRALANHLQRVTYIVPADRLKQLREMRIWIDWEHELSNMQYHPSRRWLTQNGYDPRLEKHVHIPRAKQLLAASQWAKHPYAVLHELAHAFHDQVLGFDHPAVKDTYDQMKQGGTYQEVLLYTGKKVEHYGLSNHKEYFAESTEAYFGVNDFYPFVRAELREHDPRMFRLMKETWGEVR
ncbi:MAG: metallopeptidase [Rubripirellula sp.]